MVAVLSFIVRKIYDIYNSSSWTGSLTNVHS